MKRAILALAFSGLAACATLAGDNPETAADQRFRAIYEAEWDWRKTIDPTAGEEDDTGGAPGLTTWPRVDPATQATRLAYWLDVMQRLDAIDPATLSRDQRINSASIASRSPSTSFASSSASTKNP